MGQSRRAGWALPLGPYGTLPIRFLCLPLLTLGLIAAGLALAPLLPPGPSLAGINHGATFIFFDGRWYREIAASGYHWDAVEGQKWLHYSDAAFFPLYPLIERLAARLPGGGSEGGLSLLSLIFGLWSGLAFSAFARRILPEPAAWRAALIYACWPAGCFYWMGYPTGLINLCAIHCLWLYAEKRPWRAALWCGIGTAAAPTVVFVAAALCIDRGFAWLKAGAPRQRLMGLIGFGLLSVGGLIGFVAFLWWRFGDPLVFLKAQDAWSPPRSLVAQAVIVFNPLHYLYAVHSAGGAVRGLIWRGFGTYAVGREQVNLAFQLLLGLAGLLLFALTIALGWRRLRARGVMGASLAILLGYLWFAASTPINLLCCLRLCFPALALFLVLGGWPPRGRGFALLLAALGLLLAIETALVKAGYTVI